MFAAYNNDISENMDSFISLFVDEATSMRKVKRKEDCDLDFNKIMEVMHMGNGV